MQKIETIKNGYTPKKSDLPTIGYLTTDWAWGTDPLQPNGCAWYRCVLPGMELEKRGWRVGVGVPGFSEKDGFGMVAEAGKAIHGWDIIVFKLIMQKDALNGLTRAQDLGQKIVVDVDDFFDGLSPSNRAYEATDPEKNLENNREIYAEIIRRSFAVICSTQFLFDYYSKIHKNVFLVRNGIDLHRYKSLHYLNKKRQTARPNRATIGWVGATPWRSGDLELLSGFMGNYILTNNKNVRFHHSGHLPNSPSAADQLGIDKRFITTSYLVPIGEYPNLFNGIDIGIVPLTDIPFNDAKSFIKGLEYAASGIPFISSPSAEYKFLYDAGVGRIASTQEEWIYHFNELRDLAIRKDEAQINIEKLEDFSIEKRGDDWDATMRFILEQSM
jgi:hypothetical protein